MGLTCKQLHMQGSNRAAFKESIHSSKNVSLAQIVPWELREQMMFNLKPEPCTETKPGIITTTMGCRQDCEGRPTWLTL